MFFALKRCFMRKMIEKKQKKNGFDFEAGEAYTLPRDADGTINNSYYFSAHGACGRSLYCRLGLRHIHTEVWFVYYDGKTVYTHRKNLYPTDASPLTVERTEGGWALSFCGVLEAEDGKRVEARFSGLFSASAAPLDFFSHMPPIRTATAMAGERWGKDFFAEVQKNNQVHYEEFGRLACRLSLDGEESEFTLPAVRDHSFGKRVWEYMNNHLWLMAVREDAQLNFSMVSYPAMSILEVGNLIEGEKIDLVLAAEYDRHAVVTGAVPSSLSLTLRMQSGRELSVTAECSFFTEYLFEDGAYRLLEGVGCFTVDGVAYRGIIEVGENKDKTRLFNGKKIDELKV